MLGFALLTPTYGPMSIQVLDNRLIQNSSLKVETTEATTVRRYLMLRQQPGLGIHTSLTLQHRVESSRDLIRGRGTSGTSITRSPATGVGANNWRFMK